MSRLACNNFNRSLVCIQHRSYALTHEGRRVLGKMREEKEHLKTIAEEFGVSPNTISVFLAQEGLISRYVETSRPQKKMSADEVDDDALYDDRGNFARKLMAHFNSKDIRLTGRKQRGWVLDGKPISTLALLGMMRRGDYDVR